VKYKGIWRKTKVQKTSLSSKMQLGQMKLEDDISMDMWKIYLGFLGTQVALLWVTLFTTQRSTHHDSDVIVTSSYWLEPDGLLKVH